MTAQAWIKLQTLEEWTRKFVHAVSYREKELIDAYQAMSIARLEYATEVVSFYSRHEPASMQLPPEIRQLNEIKRLIKLAEASDDHRILLDAEQWAKLRNLGDPSETIAKHITHYNAEAERYKTILTMRRMREQSPPAPAYTIEPAVTYVSAPKRTRYPLTVTCIGISAILLVVIISWLLVR